MLKNTSGNFGTPSSMALSYLNYLKNRETGLAKLKAKAAKSLVNPYKNIARYCK